MTEPSDEPTTDSGPEDEPSNTRAGIVAPSLTGDNNEPTVTEAAPTSAASGGADQGTDSPVASPIAPSEAKGDEDQPDTPATTGGNGPTAAGGNGNSTKTTDLPDEPQETNEPDSNPDTISAGSSVKPPKASAPAATSKEGFTTVTGSKPAPTSEAYEVPVDLEEDTVLGDYAEFKEASNGEQVV